MKLTKNKPPVEMTLQQMIRQLMLVLEKATPEEKQAFKRAWLDGAARMDAETQQLRQARLMRKPLDQKWLN